MLSAQRDSSSIIANVFKKQVWEPVGSKVISLNKP